ncbi:MAG: hypothetical protein WCT48_02405 [Candidatus Paceibacterota bacterium]
METEREINKEPIKNQEKSHEEIKKMGLLVSGLLATIINAGVVQEGYSAPMTPDNGTEQVIPKKETVKDDGEAIVLTPGMTKEQIEVSAQKAVTRYEMEQDFNRMLQECTEIAKSPEGQGVAVHKCETWYKSQTENGNALPALKIMKQALDKAPFNSPLFDSRAEAVLIGTAQGIIILALGAIFAVSGILNAHGVFDQKAEDYEEIIRTNKDLSERVHARNMYKHLTGHEYDGPEYQ